MFILTRIRQPSRLCGISLMSNQTRQFPRRMRGCYCPRTGWSFLQELRIYLRHGKDRTRFVATSSLSLQSFNQRREIQRQPSLSVLFVSVLASLLVLLSSHYTYQSLGHPIVKTLLLPQWMRRLHSNLSGSHNELILVTLRLLNVISSFAAGRERKSLSETFSWESKVGQYSLGSCVHSCLSRNKSLPKLLLMRRKIKNDAHFDVLARPGESC